MIFLFSILMALVAAPIPAAAGSIAFDFKRQDTSCVVVNRGDSRAYYPSVFQLARDGKWVPLKTDGQQAELPPGGTLTAGLLGTASEPHAGQPGIDSVQAVLIRFFDQAGVSFGQVALLRPPPATSHAIKAGYVNGRFRMHAPLEQDTIQATWLLAPYAEGIAPIVRPRTFTHLQPPAPRIVWNSNPFADIDTGASLPAAMLLHETPAGITLQTVQTSRAKKIAQRASWLNMKNQFYLIGLVCGICGALFCMHAYRTGHDVNNL